MWRAKKKAPVWIGVIFVILFFLVSPLIMPHSPILDIQGKECTNSAKRDTREDKSNTNPREAFGDDSVPCIDATFPSEATNEGWSTFREALKRYSKFHKEKLNQLKYSHNGEGVKTLTWACSQAKCSGLGDQLYRIEYFFLLAMMSDRLFTIYWDDALERSAKYLIPNGIDWSFFDHNKGMCTDMDTVFTGRSCAKQTFSRSSMWGFGWTKNEFSHFGDVLFSQEQHITVTGDVTAYIMFINKDFYMDPGEKIIAGFEKLGLNDILEEDTPNDTVSCGHDPLWFSILHKLGAHHLMEVPEISSGKLLVTEPWIQVSHVIFCYLFKFPQVLVSEVDTISRSLGIYNEKYIAVHLRTCFKGMPYEESYATRMIHKNWKCFDDERVWDGIMTHAFDLAETMLGPDAPVYLCTDTEVAKQRFQRIYGSRVKIANLTLEHSAHSRSQCENQQENIGDEGTQKTPEVLPSIFKDPYVSMWIDFLILSKAQVMVHADSSFSINAAFVRPLSHFNQSWVLHDNDRNCIASYMAGKTTCIC